MLFPTVAARRIGAIAPASGYRAFSASARAANLARMSLVGRLGGDPELITTPGGREVVRYTVAANYGPADDRKVSWFRVASYMPEGPSRAYLLGLSKGFVPSAPSFGFVGVLTVGIGRRSMSRLMRAWCPSRARRVRRRTSTWSIVRHSGATNRGNAKRQQGTSKSSRESIPRRKMPALRQKLDDLTLRRRYV